MTTTLEKVETFVATLDDDQQAELANLGPAPTKDDLTPALLQRLKEVVGSLTADDRAEILAVVTADQEGDEVEGFASIVRDHRTRPVTRDHRGSAGGGAMYDFVTDAEDPVGTIQKGCRGVYNAIGGLF